LVWNLGQLEASIALGAGIAGSELLLARGAAELIEERLESGGGLRLLELLDHYDKAIELGVELGELLVDLDFDLGELGVDVGELVIG
jgi:hypothetical protein